jgi:hypothetical protein
MASLSCPYIKFSLNNVKEISKASFYAFFEKSQLAESNFGQIFLNLSFFSFLQISDQIKVHKNCRLTNPLRQKCL